jgi:hypothetical protein
MPLKKNDKIVIAIALFVIVVAGIGIALYTSPPAGNTPVTPVPETNTYAVSWNVQSGSISDITGYAAKNSPFEQMITIPHGNLKTITLNLSWIDNKALLGRFGLDTLGIEVTAPDGSTASDSAKSMQRTKAGNVEVTFTNVNPQPSTEPIVAQSPSDAQTQLMKSPYYSDKWLNQDITVKVSCNPGERILWRLRDKGNSFTVAITYEYYSGETSKMVETFYPGDTGGLVSTGEQPAALGQIVSLGSGVRW